MWNAISITTVFLAAAFANVVDAIVFKDCWLLIGGLDDASWTHGHNLARLEIYHHLQAKYPNHTFHSRAGPNVRLMPQEDQANVVQKFIDNGCNLIYSSSIALLKGRVDEYVTNYTNISWAIQTHIPNLQPDNAPPNLIEPELRWFEDSFVAGAVAATFSQTCGVFINSFEKNLPGFQHAMGFALGYNWASKPNQTLHVVTTNDFFNFEAEVEVARQLVEKRGCDVLSHRSMSTHVDRFLFELYLRTGGEKKALSIARYNDMSTFVGDTTFTSMIVNFTEWLLPVIESSFRSAATGKPGPMYDMSRPLEEKAPLVASTRPMLGPFTPMVDVDKAEEARAAAWEHLKENGNPLCGARYRLDGERAGTFVPTKEGDDCPETRLYHLFAADSRQKTYQKSYPLTYLEIPNVNYIDDFKDGGAECGGGQYYSYGENLELSCHPCPVNTFRLDTGRTAEECVPCKEGTTASNPGSQHCSVEVEKDLRQLDHGVRIYGYVIVALIAGLSITFFCWVQFNRTSRVVRASQPIFLHIFSIGVLILGSSIIPLTVDDSVADTNGCNVACILFPWLLSIGFCTAFSALFSKIWRINRVMDAANAMRRVTIQAKDVLIPLLVMGTINIILLTLWTVLDPPTWSKVPIKGLETSYLEDNVRIISVTAYGTCWSNWGPASTVLASLLIVLNLLAIIFANIQAYRARHISDELSESKYIAMSMWGIFQALLVGVPLSALVIEDPTAFFFVVSSVILVISMSLLILVFVPKIVMHKGGDSTLFGVGSRGHNQAHNNLAPTAGMTRRTDDPTNNLTPTAGMTSRIGTPMSNLTPTPGMTSKTGDADAYAINQHLTRQLKEANDKLKEANDKIAKFEASVQGGDGEADAPNTHLESELKEANERLPGARKKIVERDALVQDGDTDSSRGLVNLLLPSGDEMEVNERLDSVESQNYAATSDATLADGTEGKASGRRVTIS